MPRLITGNIHHTELLTDGSLKLVFCNFNYFRFQFRGQDLGYDCASSLSLLAFIVSDKLAFLFP